MRWPWGKQPQQDGCSFTPELPKTTLPELAVCTKCYHAVTRQSMKSVEKLGSWSGSCGPTYTYDIYCQGCKPPYDRVGWGGESYFRAVSPWLRVDKEGNPIPVDECGRPIGKAKPAKVKK